MSALSQIQMAEQEIEALTNMFNGYGSMCNSRHCIAMIVASQQLKGFS
jgi:hypothetical protein